MLALREPIHRRGLNIADGSFGRIESRQTAHVVVGLSNDVAIDVCIRSAALSIKYRGDCDGRAYSRTITGTRRALQSLLLLMNENKIAVPLFTHRRR